MSNNCGHLVCFLFPKYSQQIWRLVKTRDGGVMADSPSLFAAKLPVKVQQDN
jgi:hypothetical protein